MKEQGRERDDLKLELVRLPEGSNIVVHPAAIKAFAERLQVAGNPLRSGRAYLKATLYGLEETGELSSLIRDVIESVTLIRDFDNRIVIRVTSWLEPFLKGNSKAEKNTPNFGGDIGGSGSAFKVPKQHWNRWRTGRFLRSMADCAGGVTRYPSGQSQLAGSGVLVDARVSKLLESLLRWRPVQREAPSVAGGR